MEYGERSHETGHGFQKLKRLEIDYYETRLVRKQVEGWTVCYKCRALRVANEGGDRECVLENMKSVRRWRCVILREGGEIGFVIM